MFGARVADARGQCDHNLNSENKTGNPCQHVLFFYRLFLFSAISPLASPNKQDAASNAIKSPTDELDTVTFGR